MAELVIPFTSEDGERERERETIMYEDHGFESRYDGLCVVCLANYEPGSMIATAPRIYHKRNKRGGLLRFGHLACVINARKTSVVSLGGEP